MKPRKLASLPTIRRLPSYLHVVEQALREGKHHISGTVIAEELELEPIQVRKDLAITGIAGRPRIGFPVEALIDAIHSFLYWDQHHRAVVVGCGNLGSALMGYAEFARHGLNIVAAFDVNESRIGTLQNGKPVYAMSDMPKRITSLGASIALLTVPSSEAQAVAESIIDAGITAIWNFTNIKLKVPPQVMVEKEDLSSGYAVLSVKIRTMNS